MFDLLQQTGSLRAARFFTLLASGLVCGAAHAADEIQVYANELKKPGEAGVELHANFTPSGFRSPDYAGQVPSHHAFHLTPEFSWGLTDNVDWGLYIPATRAADSTWHADGIKGRIKYVRLPEHEGGLFYGVNFELASNRISASEQRWTAEIRSIFGRETENWLLAGNATLGLGLANPNRSGPPELTLSGKAVRKLSEHWGLGAEHYAGLGPINEFAPWAQSGQTSYLIGEYESKGWDVHFGIGHGWTNATEKTVLKMIFGFEF